MVIIVVMASIVAMVALVARAAVVVMVANMVMVFMMARVIMLGGHGSDLEDRNDRRVVAAQKPRVTAASPELV